MAVKLSPSRVNKYDMAVVRINKLWFDNFEDIRMGNTVCRRGRVLRC